MRDPATEVERCAFLCVHDEVVRRLTEQMPPLETLCDLSELFKLFADSTRIRILYALFEAELCVCDIAQLLGLTQTAVSHQLRQLKQGRLVSSRREGKVVFYSLADDHVRSVIDQGMEHIME